MAADLFAVNSASSRESHVVLGIDIGGTHVQAGVVAHDGRMLAIVHRPTVPGNDGDPLPTIDGICEAAQMACAEADLTIQEIAAVGVAAAGALDAPRGVVLQSPNLRWQNLPLRDLLVERLQRPVIVENDVNAAALGEWNAAGENGDLLAIWVGTGVGGGLILSGRIHHGAQHTAGEIGHLVIDPAGVSNAPEQPGTRTVEDLCSRRGLRAQIAAAGHPGAMTLTAGEIADAWRSGDPLITPCVDRAADLLGIAAANVVTLLALDRIVIGGGMTESLGEPWIRRITASFTRDVFPPELAGCRIEMTKLAGEAGIRGAACLARGMVVAGC